MRFFKLPTLEVLASSDEGTDQTFSCFAKDFSPKDFDIKWLKDEKEIQENIYEVNITDGGTKNENGTIVYSAASFLKVLASEWINPGTKFTCEFNGKDAEGIKSVNASMSYKEECQNGE